MHPTGRSALQNVPPCTHTHMESIHTHLLQVEKAEAFFTTFYLPEWKTSLKWSFAPGWGSPTKQSTHEASQRYHF